VRSLRGAPHPRGAAVPGDLGLDAALHPERRRSPVPAGVLWSGLPADALRIGVTVLFDRGAIDAIVLDIEGTTTPIAFVTDVLFPHVRRHLGRHLADERNADARRRVVDLLRDEWMRDAARGERPPEWIEDSHGALAAYVEWLMDRDRKSTGLKLLQGHIWEGGYRSGELEGQVFPDVVPALQRWRASGLAIAIYSSGSEQGQRLLFGHTALGDLTACFVGFFDTTVGAKTSADSYGAIAARLRVPADRLVCVSDAVREVEAAQAAGCRVLLCVREGESRADAAHWDVVRSFDEIAIV